jgi:hypothetical protein
MDSQTVQQRAGNRVLAGGEYSSLLLALHELTIRPGRTPLNSGKHLARIQV